MSRISRFKWLPRIFVAVTFSLLFALATTLSAFASVSLLQLSSDPFTVGPGQHATEVEPDTFAAGNTLVSAFQVGRIFGGGATDIGFATSTDGGSTFTSGFLPGTTTAATPPGIYSATSDASVVFATVSRCLPLKWMRQAKSMSSGKTATLNRRVTPVISY